MKKIILTSIIFLLIFTSLQTYARKKLDYDDIYKVILSGDKDKSYTLLIEYQKQEPEFANTYFQLALIARDWAKDFNPFTEFMYTKQFIYNTKLYLGLAKLKLKEEKRKNRDLYKNAGITPAGKKLQIEDIDKFLDSEIKSIKIYEKNIIKIINNFNKSSNAYNECVNIFMKINTDYSKIKNIYLADNEFIAKPLDSLEMYYDSTIIYFNNYKSAIKAYPIKGYNQEYKLKQIITYRLNGLTNSNFMENQFFLWDYKTWVNNVRKTKGEKIRSNYLDIVSVNNLIKSKLKFLNKSIYSDDFKPFKLDEKFIYKIEKYDNNSLLVKLFKLKTAKENYYTYFRKTINNPTKISEFTLEKSALYCYNLFKKKEYAININNDFKKSIKASDILKYKKFYLTEYNGFQGLKDYSNRQVMFFNARQKEANSRLKNRLYSSSFFANSGNLNYNGKLIKSKKVLANFIYSENDSYEICSFKKTNNKLWISGFYKDLDGKIQGFSAYSNDFANVLNLKSSTKSDSSKIINFLVESFTDGMFTIETSIGTTITNTLLKYDNSGILLTKKSLPFSKLPRFMAYDEINNSIIIIFSGINIDATKDADREQIIYNLNFDDEFKSYTIKQQSKEYVFDIIKINNKILLFSNFINYIENNNLINSDAGSNSVATNVLITTIENAKITKQVAFKNKHAFWGTKAIKLNSNLINLLGFKTSYKNNNYNELKNVDLYNLLIDSKLQKLNMPWHD